MKGFCSLTTTYLISCPGWTAKSWHFHLVRCHCPPTSAAGSFPTGVAGQRSLAHALISAWYSETQHSVRSPGRVAVLPSDMAAPVARLRGIGSFNVFDENLIFSHFVFDPSLKPGNAHAWTQRFTHLPWSGPSGCTTDLISHSDSTDIT